jgi:Flp pilus assembly protein CpaB
MRPKPRRHRLRPALALRRRPRLWWLLTLLVALATGSLVASIVGRAEAVRQAWGATELVAVARRDIRPGTAVDDGDVHLVSRPQAMVPPGALHHVPEGQVASALISAGEVVVPTRLAPLGLTGVAATLPEGSRAVAIPVEPGLAPPLVVGDHVDVLVAVDPEAAGSGPPGFVVAAGALVVAVDEAAVTVAVAASTAPRIAVALGQGAVSLALVGP